MKVGDLYEIRKGKPDGIPIIRVERIDEDGQVWVSDWETPERRAYRPPLACGITYPDVRPFALGHEVARMIRHWRKLTPNAGGKPRE